MVRTAVTYLRQALGYKVLVPLLLAAKGIFSLVDHERDAKRIMVNVGGGVFVKRHWKNLDYSSTHYPYKLSVLDFNFDLTGGAPLPFASDSVTFFYSSHTLEHLPQRYCPYIFREFYRCLKPGGAVRLTMPDFDKICDGYRARRTDFWGVGADPEECLLRGIATSLVGRLDARELREKFEALPKVAFADYLTGLIPLEAQMANMSQHCNWWNFDKLRQSLADVGFTRIEHSAPYASRFPEMRDKGSFLGIESLCRMPSIRGFDVAHPDQSVYVEAIKDMAGSA